MVASIHKRTLLGSWLLGSTNLSYTTIDMCSCACVWGILNECILGQVGMNQPFGYKLAQTGYKLTEFGYEMTGYKTTMGTKQPWVQNNRGYETTMHGYETTNMGTKWLWVQTTMDMNWLWVWNNHEYKTTMGMKWPWVQVTSIHHLCFPNCSLYISYSTDKGSLLVNHELR